MQLSIHKIRELELFAKKLNTEPDRLLDILISFAYVEPQQVRTSTPEEKLKAIEDEALDKGWTYEQLWKRPKFKNYSEMGLICFIEDKTFIGEITEKYISLVHEMPLGEPVIRNFYNSKVEQPWINKVEKELNP
jgi:hypothetical protein